MLPQTSMLGEDCASRQCPVSAQDFTAMVDSGSIATFLRRKGDREQGKLHCQLVWKLVEWWVFSFDCAALFARRVLFAKRTCTTCENRATWTHGLHLPDLSGLSCWAKTLHSASHLELPFDRGSFQVLNGHLASRSRHLRIAVQHPTACHIHMLLLLWLVPERRAQYPPCRLPCPMSDHASDVLVCCSLFVRQSLLSSRIRHRWQTLWWCHPLASIVPG